MTMRYRSLLATSAAMMVAEYAALAQAGRLAASQFCGFAAGVRLWHSTLRNREKWRTKARRERNRAKMAAKSRREQRRKR